jgi:general stress protein 26
MWRKPRLSPRKKSGTYLEIYTANVSRMMNSVKLSFLKDKIADLQTALFSNESDAVLKLPTTVVNVLQVDEAGQIWFRVTKPSQYVAELDKEFPAKLNFFRKGKEYFLNITGKAYIINDPEEITHLVSLSDEVREGAVNSRFILVKMRIQKAEYFEKQAQQKTGLGFNGLFSKIYSWLFDMRAGMRPAFFLEKAA